MTIEIEELRECSRKTHEDLQKAKDRMKAMEAILESCPHEINCHEESPTCIRCRWDALKGKQ